jgi:hypothetical protein
MAIMDRVKQLMKGRSAQVEQAVDKAVASLGRSSESLKRHADTVKERARSLDPEHGAAPLAPPESPAPDAAGEPGAGPATDAAPTSPPAASPPPAPAPVAEPTSGPSLRGDLVDPPDDRTA